MKNKYLSLWSINDVLDLNRMKKQLDQMKMCGLAGIIFHPRYYPEKPKYMSTEYLEILSELIVYAKGLKMEFWIYDENGWPSGSADGQVIKENPQLRKRYVELRENKQSKEYELVLVEEHAPSPIDKEAVTLL